MLQCNMVRCPLRDGRWHIVPMPPLSSTHGPQLQYRHLYNAAPSYPPVVDGLYAAVERAGLYVANLTLEPIAAINVAIPEKYRLLN
mgnify:CR=1 FL=1